MATSPPKPLMDRKPNIHKLLQADVVDKEAAGSKDLKDDTVLHTYDDEKHRVTNVRKILQTGANDVVKDVLADENYRVTGDNVNKKGDIWNLLHKPTPEDYIKQNPSSILNPNWKGPMPLYPDELTSMITQGPMSVNRIKTLEHSKTTSETGETLVDLVKNPIHSKDSPSETDEFEIDPTDMEDIVDYFPNNYERVVDMAQAYSDYGVLDGKKSETEKKVDDKVVLEGAGNRVKLSLKGLKKRLKNNIIWRSQNDEYPSNIPSEGFRFEIKPDPLQSNGNNVNMPLEVYNHLKQHVQIHPQPTSVAVYNTVPPFDKDYVTKILVPVSYLVPIQKNTKNGSKTIIFSVVNGKRSLKSVDLTEDSVEDGDDYANEDNNMTDNVRSVLNNIKLKSKRECSNNTYKINQEDAVSNSALMLAQKGVMSSKNDKFEYELVNNTLGTTKNDDVTNSNKKLASEDELSNNTDINLSHFMMVLSNCFSTLDGVNIGMHTLGRTTSTPYHVTLKEINTNSIIETSSPKYDQGMIANVGHRSRLLLSIDVNVTNEIENKKDDNDLEGKKEMVNNNIDPKNTNITITNNIITPKATNINENKTKSIVKRNADDTNLIFSHDIYDDEYGVAMDHFDNSIRNKHSVELNNLLKKPNDWFHDKMRNIADRFQKKMDSFSKEPKNGEGVKSKKENRLKGIKSMKSQPKDAIYKRISRKAAEEKPELTRKTDFTALTAKMKKICRKAVKDIAQTKDLTGVKASKEEQVSSSLMRRLVGLMDDLVDYQVQQRTCHKLTPDLQNFLEWLTSPNTESESNKFSFGQTNDEYPEKSISKIDDTTYPSLEMAPTLEREDKPDARSDCLGTLQAVQELMRQYDDMNDDEKSKMIDVKDYLESQMHYLQKLWSSNYEYGIYDTNSIRFKRDTSRQKRHEKHKNFNKKIKYGKLYGNKLSPHNNVKNTINYIKATNNNDNAVNNENIHSENSSDEHNNNNDHNEQNNKSDEQNKNGHNEQNNNSDEQNNISQEQNNNGHYKQNNNSDEPNNNELTEQNNNSDEKNNYGHNKQNNNDDKEQNNKGNAETDSKSVKVKRNLRDVYYKAIADAKKITTVKNVFNEN